MTSFFFAKFTIIFVLIVWNKAFLNSNSFGYSFCLFFFLFLWFFPAFSVVKNNPPKS